MPAFHAVVEGGAIDAEAAGGATDIAGAQFEGGFDVAALPGGERRVEIDAGGGLQVLQGGLHALLVVVLDDGAPAAAVNLVGGVEFGQQLLPH